MSSGLIGPYKDYILTFPLIQQDPKKKKTFEQAFPDIDDFMRLRDSKSEDVMAKNAAAFMLSKSVAEGNKGPPKWLIKAMNGG